MIHSIVLNKLSHKQKSIYSYSVGLRHDEFAGYSSSLSIIVASRDRYYSETQIAHTLELQSSRHDGS